MLKVFIARGSGVNKNHLRARHPAVVEYDGVAPSFVAPNPVSAQQVQFLEWLINKAYELSGISQLSASSKNPLGSNASGKALDTMEDMESDRFSHVQMQYAMFRLDIGQCMIDEARDLARDASGPKARIKRAELAPWIRELDWKKVEIDAGNYHLGMEAINFLPESRAGKLAYVGELAKNGLVTDPMTIMAQMDEPDLARANRYQLGPYRNLERIMELLADESVPLADLMPDPHFNFQLGKVMAEGEYNFAMATDAPEEVLERYRQWLSQLEGLEKKRAQSTTGGAMAAGGLPMVPGGAPAGPPGMGPMPPMPPPMPPPAPGMAMA
jgi:hypothetical protein